MKSIEYRDNLYKKLKISSHFSVEYFTHKTTLAMYKNILKNVLE